MNVHKFPLIAALLFALLSVACTADQFTTDLTAVLTIAEQLAPAIETAAGVPAATQLQITDYLSAAQSCSSAATGITTFTAAELLAITGTCAKAVAPALPAGTPTNVASLVGQEATAISTMVANLPKATAFVLSHPAMADAMFQTARTSKPNQRKLKALKKRNEALASRIAAIRAKLAAKK